MALAVREIMADEVERSTFDEAVRRFRIFLLSQDWPAEILWIRHGDVIRRPGQATTICRQEDSDRAVEAERDYEHGRVRGLGVMLEAICTLGNATCAVVSYPSDEREAELLMYPSDGGLKLSVAVPRTEGVVRWSSC